MNNPSTKIGISTVAGSVQSGFEISALLDSQSLLSGKTVIVSGGGSAGALAGVGSASALRCGQAGANVVVVDRDRDRAEYTVRALQDIGADARSVVADLTTTEGCELTASKAIEEFGGIDVLINSAAIVADEPTRSDVAMWERMMNVNLLAAKMLIDAVLPNMRERKQGVVVSISSIGAQRGGSGPIYAASKAGLEALSRATAFREGRNGVRFNCVAPGHLHSPMGVEPVGALNRIQSKNQTSPESEDLVRSMRNRASLTGSEGTPWDVADAVLFLAGPLSKFINGVTLTVDGGATSAMPLAMWRTIAGSEIAG